MKNDGQPFRDSFPWISQCTKDPHWLKKVLLFSTEIWAEQLKKHPVDKGEKCKCKKIRIKRKVAHRGNTEK